MPVAAGLRYLLRDGTEGFVMPDGWGAGVRRVNSASSSRATAWLRERLYRSPPLRNKGVRARCPGGTTEIGLAGPSLRILLLPRDPAGRAAENADVRFDKLRRKKCRGENGGAQQGARGFRPGDYFAAAAYSAKRSAIFACAASPACRMMRYWKVALRPAASLKSPAPSGCVLSISRSQKGFAAKSP